MKYGTDKFIQIAVSIANTNITGIDSDFIESSSTRKTAPIAIRFTLSLSFVIVSIKS